ncbi:MAG: hypothetical protein KKA73_10760 [Chloroflexi bacterium]|nr:hypothetical protein [Chloroflexota bacterium]MBU1748158.1 hypothetical protein [Chloroflexota bacterium]MBU1878101.1 hypothetical protein [Chloroflexota bacterium]
MAEIMADTVDGLVVVDGDRYFLVPEDGPCTCGEANCAHRRLARPEFIHRYRYVPSDEQCPCGTAMRIYHNDLGRLAICPACGHGSRQRKGQCNLLYRRNGRRARTATRYL